MEVYKQNILGTGYVPTLKQKGSEAPIYLGLEDKAGLETENSSVATE